MEYFILFFSSSEKFDMAKWVAYKNSKSNLNMGKHIIIITRYLNFLGNVNLCPQGTSLEAKCKNLILKIVHSMS
jgi:hypothetical protein